MRQCVSWVVVGLVGAGFSVACLRSPQSEVLVSAGMTLNPQWQEIHPSDVMRTASEWSELLLEVPGLRVDADKGLVLEDGTSIDVEGYLTTYDSKRVDLGVSTVSYAGRTVVRLSASVLEWKQQNYRFRSVSLKSDKPLKVGRVIWMSYDPRSTKSGVVFPRALG